MSTGYYLLDNKPARSQYRYPRRAAESGVVVVHTAENTPDTVATDGGAEAVASFIRTRTTPGSYHVLADSDSYLRMMPWDYEAYQDGTGSNSHAVGVSVATRADWWPWAPQAWRDGAIDNLAKATAEYARWLQAKRGIVIPPRRITRDQSEARLPGFISHGERDPGRRHDPGAHFPWDLFLSRYAYHILGKDPDMSDALTRASYLYVEAEKAGLTSAQRAKLLEGGIDAQPLPTTESIVRKAIKAELGALRFPTAAQIAAEVVKALPAGSGGDLSVAQMQDAFRAVLIEQLSQARITLPGG